MGILKVGRSFKMESGIPVKVIEGLGRCARLKEEMRKRLLLSLEALKILGTID